MSKNALMQVLVVLQGGRVQEVRASYPERVRVVIEDRDVPNLECATVNQMGE